jgi:hypothetical protein
MKARRLFVVASCLLLVTVSGCVPKRAPVSEVVVIPQQDDQPPHAQTPGVFAEKGGTLTFTSDAGSPPDTTLEVQFLKNGVPVQVCREGNLLSGQSPLTCHVVLNGDFDIAVSQITQGKRHPRRPPLKLYVRPCKGCDA